LYVFNILFYCLSLVSPQLGELELVVLTNLFNMLNTC
jgi:hypothetical protein